MSLQTKILILARISSYFTFFFVIALSAIGYFRFNQFKRIKNGNIIFPTLILIIYSIQFYVGIYNNSWAKYKYGNYKNYFIEILKENYEKNDEEKINTYIREGQKYRDKKDN